VLAPLAFFFGVYCSIGVTPFIHIGKSTGVICARLRFFARRKPI
jgi:hypothetical protein